MASSSSSRLLLERAFAAANVAMPLAAIAASASTTTSVSASAGGDAVAVDEATRRDALLAVWERDCESLVWDVLFLAPAATAAAAAQQSSDCDKSASGGGGGAAGDVVVDDGDHRLSADALDALLDALQSAAGVATHDDGDGDDHSGVVAKEGVRSERERNLALSVRAKLAAAAQDVGYEVREGSALQLALSQQPRSGGGTFQQLPPLDWRDCGSHGAFSPLSRCTGGDSAVASVLSQRWLDGQTVASATVDFDLDDPLLKPVSTWQRGSNGNALAGVFRFDVDIMTLVPPATDDGAATSSLGVAVLRSLAGRLRCLRGDFACVRCSPNEIFEQYRAAATCGGCYGARAGAEEAFALSWRAMGAAAGLSPPRPAAGAAVAPVSSAQVADRLSRASWYAFQTPWHEELYDGTAWRFGIVCVRENGREVVVVAARDTD